MVEFPKPATMKCTKKILAQMKKINNFIYTINEDEDDLLSFCVFCYIKYNKENIPVMITTYHKIKDLANKDKIKILSSSG